MTHCVIFKIRLSTSSASWLGVLNWRPCRPPPPVGHFQWLQTGSESGSHWHQLPSRHLHILFHNTHNFRLITWLFLLIYIGVSDWWLGQGSVCNTYWLTNAKIQLVRRCLIVIISISNVLLNFLQYNLSIIIFCSVIC